ncbi:nitrous oxide reductase family maturation protein NosD [Conexibacter sp. CPCC 206217]|uniref:right-handed parallel beta-helix repeat-containing protein n=1 Tax=Conexibacter sp. CPCC 206217 TaxID=3064574 RepID=UPI002725C412|nr:right-handed parallel beta-helix repeat-containing protein [Conexibacter sp. CPCC 206217]MDO8209093.1 right-handed parallel beta-helix repeat-containing protein [Conexibacter sp. CPCC 206217]
MHPRARTVLVAVASLAASAALVPGTASAATRFVAPGGSDAGNLCLDASAPCATIAPAVTAADPGDTVQVAAGEYVLTATIRVNKAVTIVGAQAGVDARERAGVPETVVTGTIPAGGTGALIALGADGASVDGLTVSGNGRPGISASIAAGGYGIRNSVITGNGVGIDLETSDAATASTVVAGNRIEANNNGTLQSGIYGDGPAANVEIVDNLFRGHTNVPINISGRGVDQRNLSISRNRFEGERHLLLLGATGVTVSDNTFVDGRSQAIAVQGGVDGLDITANTIDAPALDGILFVDYYGMGPSSDTRISGNTITGAGAAGVDVSTRTTTAARLPGYSGPLAIHANRLVGNAGAGVVNEIAGATVDATDNWWGCNAGPGGDGCDTVDGAVASSPQLVLSGVATPASIGFGESATVTASLATDSAGATVAGLPDGIPVRFDAVLGTLSLTSAPLQSSIAESVFTAASAAGTAGASVTVDSQTTPVALDVVAPVEQPPIEQPPAEQPPAEQPPAVVPPVVPAPPVVPPVKPAPTPAPYTLTLKSPSGDGVTVSARGVVTIARVNCRASGCRITAKRVTVKIGRKTYVATVTIAGNVRKGRSAPIRIVLPQAARRALAQARRGRATVRLTIASGGRRTTVKKTIKLKAARRDARSR